MQGFLPVGMRVWVVYTLTRTRIPDGYKNSSNNIPVGAKCLPYPPPYRVKPVGYSDFRYPLPSRVSTMAMATAMLAVAGVAARDGQAAGFVGPVSVASQN